jgi:DNA-binding CsgD family transcriptional regulator
MSDEVDAAEVALPVPHDAVQPDDFSALVADIYDTTLEPARWPAVLDACRAFVGGHSANVYAKGVTGLGGQVYHTDGLVGLDYARLYFTHYARIDPTNTGHIFAEIDQPIITADIIDLEEFDKSRVGQEWVRPQGLIDFVSAPIERRGSWAKMFAVFRHERHGYADEATRRRLSLLVPHVRRAVAIGETMRQAQARGDHFAETIDGLASGVFLVDDEGRLVHSNISGRQMLRGDAPIALGSGTARLERIAKNEAVRLLGNAGDAEPSGRDRSLAFETPDGERFVTHVLPLTSGARLAASNGHNAVAALFVQRASRELRSVPEVLARTFGLTPSELRVLLGIVEAGGVAETAEALGIGESTVKTHLHRVFSKTETKRQADLVKLVAAFASPLARRTAP